MGADHCEKEDRVMEAVRSGRWPHTLREHAAWCAVCGETLLVARYLSVEWQAARQSAILPDGAVVWQRLQARARRDALERATRPITLIERAARLCAVVALGLTAFWQWPELMQFAGWLARTLAPSGPPAFVLLITSAGATLVLTGAAFYFARAKQ